MVTASVLFYVSEWVIRLVMVVVVMRHKRPSSAMAWLLVVFFEPWIGLVLYLLIGGEKLPQRRIERHARLVEELHSVGARFEDHPNMVRPEVQPQVAGAVSLAQALGRFPILGGNSLEMLIETQDVIDRLVADIDRAAETVHLLFYIYTDDETGERVTDALIRAARRGVTCRVLVDAVGSRPLIPKQGKRMRRNGVQLREMLPVGLFRRQVARMDLRNHRKLAVIDGRIAYTGSQNIVDASYGHKDLAWHDIMVRLTGPVVLELQAVFVGDWFFETGELLTDDDLFPAPEVTGSIPVQTLPSGPNYPTENYQRFVVSALHAAQRKVTITTPYFVPDEAFLQAMQVAVLRGVEVELIVPARSDQKLVGAASRAYYEDVLEAGVKLYLYKEGILHSKTMSVDEDIALIGSSNFDIRSFALNFEINLLLYGAEVTRQLRAVQQTYLAQSVPLEREAWAKRPEVKKILQGVSKLFSPLL